MTRVAEDVHAPLAAPTYLTHVTVPVFRRGRALAAAIGLHAVAVLLCLLVLHHRFRVTAPDEATVALVIEPSPYVGSGPTVISPVTQPSPHPAAAAALPAPPHPVATATANAERLNSDPLPAGPAADLPLPAPPAPPAPRPVPVTKPASATPPANHQGDQQPTGQGLIVDTKIIPARPEDRNNVPPSYPREALLHGEEGRVLLSIQVEPSGRASAVSIIASSGFSILDNAARDAVLGWHFLPADYRGSPVSSTLLLPIKFEIETNSAAVK